jgi:NAD(P)-dependent dehydrogenase (short-subunit alcohol dehydrogenase family)
MNLELHGRTAFVSGSTQGIGYAIASALTEGAEVIINRRAPAAVEAAVSRLRSEHPGALLRGVAADLADPGETSVCCRTSARSTSW